MFSQMFEELLGKGLAYRYSLKRWEALRGGSKPFPSPTRIVQTRYGPMIEELIQLTLKPVVIDQRMVDWLEKLTETINHYVETVVKLFSTSVSGEIDPKIAQLVGTDNERRMVKTSPGYTQILPFIRLDCVRTASGFKIVDFNTTRPAGVGDTIILNQFYQELNCQGEPYETEKMFVQAITEASRKWFERKGKDRECVCQMAITEDEGDWQNFFVLSQAMERAGWQSELVDPFSGRLSGPVIIRSRIKEEDSAFGFLTNLYPDEACIISPLFRRYVGNKYWFYLLATAEYRPFFVEEMGEEAYRILLEALPKTGIIEDDQAIFPDETLPLGELRRKDFVVKVPAGSSASGMIFGRSTSRRKWDQLLRERGHGMLLQEYFPAKENHLIVDQDGQLAEKLLYTKYGMFILGGKLAGIEVMARPSVIVHGARDTYFSCVFKTRMGETTGP